MKNNDRRKEYYNDERILKRYGNAVFNIGLWESEKALLEKYSKKNNLFLDLGCGSGRTTFSLYEIGYKNIIGVDIAQKMIEQCQDINIMKNLNIPFQVGDAANLDFEDNYFDFVFFSFNGFSGIPGESNRIKALQEVYRVLKPNCYFIFTAHERNEEFYFKNKDKFLEENNQFVFEKHGDFIFSDVDGAYDYLHLYSIEEMKELINKNTNFAIVDIVNRDENFKETKETKEFSDNTIFYILKKEEINA